MKNRWFLTLMTLLIIFSLGMTACASPKVDEPVVAEQAAEEPAAEEPAAEVEQEESADAVDDDGSKTVGVVGESEEDAGSSA